MDDDATSPTNAAAPAAAHSPSLQTPSAVTLADAVRWLLRVSHVASPDELPALVARAAGRFGAEDAAIYLADLQQRVLVPFLDPVLNPGPGYATSPRALGIDATVAGRAFQHLRPLTQPVTLLPDRLPGKPATESPRTQDWVQVWQPLLNGTERLGVLAVTLPAVMSEDAAATGMLEQFASVVAELVMTKTLYGDSIVRLRRTTEMALAAEVQWSLLPPLTFANSSVTVAGGLEPAYEVAGDSLDYAVDAGIARFAVFDGMGHGIVSAQLISLVVAAYRNARRAGRTLTETAAHIEAAVSDVFRVESFATGLLCELDTTTGVLTWLSAGHHEPLLLRDGRLVRALQVAPLLPLGLNESLTGSWTPAKGSAAVVGSEQLQPGDMLLLYTDGVIEARSPDGEFFGQDRLVDMVVRNLAAGLPTPETMRRLVHALLAHQAGDLDDDATLLLVEWHGAD